MTSADCAITPLQSCPAAGRRGWATCRSAHAPSTCPTVAILVVRVFLSRKNGHDIRRRYSAQPTVPETIAFHRYVDWSTAHRAVMFFRRRIAALRRQSREFDALFCAVIASRQPARQCVG